jgi:cytochrome c-type biogenesis protein CcmH/NrfG
VSRPVLKPIVGGARLAGVIGAALLLVTPLGSRVSATIFEGAGLQARVVIYESAIAAVRDRPLLGWGPNNFAAAYPHYRTTDYAGSPGNQPDSSAHNWVLESAVTTGVLGALGSLVLAGVAAQRLFNRGLDRMPMIAGPILLGLIGYWVHGLVSVESLGVDWFGWAALGVAASITGRPDDVSVRRRLEPVAAVASVALACIVATTGWTSIAASHMALQAKRETAARHADPAISAATNATKADSARSQYWEILGHAYGLKEQWRDAGDAFAEAVRRAPYIASNYANLARSRARQAFAGDQSARASALDAARRGARLDPNNWEAESVLAEIQSAFGEPEEALTTLALAVSLNPRNSTNDIVASEAATRVSDPQRARALIERILEKKETALLRVTLAKVALRLSDRELALTNARRAIELEPGNADALKVVSSLGG